MLNTLSKINLSKVGWEEGRSTSIWKMSLNILGFFERVPHRKITKLLGCMAFSKPPSISGTWQFSV